MTSEVKSDGRIKGRVYIMTRRNQRNIKIEIKSYIAELFMAKKNIRL